MAHEPRARAVFHSAESGSAVKDASPGGRAVRNSRPSAVLREKMPSRRRTHHFMRLLVASTLVWAFAVPVIHLACGMVTERIEVLCEEQEAGGHAAHEHATESLELHFAANSRGQTSESLAECCRSEERRVGRECR